MTLHDLQDARDALVAAARHLAAAGLSPGSSGNLSIRVKDVLLVTPTGSSLARVLPEHLAVVRPDGTVVSGHPSKEVPLHVAVHQRRPGTRAVVHLHSPHAVAVSCLATEAERPTLPALTPYQVMRVGDLPVAPYARPGSPGLAAGVAALIDRHAAVLMANHGLVVVGAGLDGAVDLAEEVETAARVALLVRGQPVRPLTHQQVDELGR